MLNLFTLLSDPCFIQYLIVTGRYYNHEFKSGEFQLEGNYTEFERCEKLAIKKRDTDECMYSTILEGEIPVKYFSSLRPSFLITDNNKILFLFIGSLLFKIEDQCSYERRFDLYYILIAVQIHCLKLLRTFEKKM